MLHKNYATNFVHIFSSDAVDKITVNGYNVLVGQSCIRTALLEGSEEMEDMNTTEALLRAILELIAKCDTLEELRESVKKIMGE